LLAELPTAVILVPLYVTPDAPAAVPPLFQKDKETNNPRLLPEPTVNDNVAVWPEVRPAAVVLPLLSKVIPGIPTEGEPTVVVLEMPVGVMVYVEDSAGIPSADVLAMPLVVIVMLLVIAGEPKPAAVAMPVGLMLTLPGESVGLPRALVLAIPDGLIDAAPDESVGAPNAAVLAIPVALRV
jgi:hypothetical protein